MEFLCGSWMTFLRLGLLVPLQSFDQYFLFGVFSVFRPHCVFYGWWCLLLFEAFVLVRNQHLFFWSIRVVVVNVCCCCASITHPLLLQNSTMFFEVTWPFSLEFWLYFLVGALTSAGLTFLPFNVFLWDLLLFLLQGPFSIGVTHFWEPHFGPLPVFISWTYCTWVLIMALSLCCIWHCCTYTTMCLCT